MLHLVFRAADVRLKMYRHGGFRTMIDSYFEKSMFKIIRFSFSIFG